MKNLTTNQRGGAAGKKGNQNYFKTTIIVMSFY